MSRKMQCDLVCALVNEIKDDVAEYESYVKKNGREPYPENVPIGCNKSAIIRRCKLAREELLRISKSFDRW